MIRNSPCLGIFCVCKKKDCGKEEYDCHDCGLYDVFPHRCGILLNFIFQIRIGLFNNFFIFCLRFLGCHFILRYAVEINRWCKERIGFSASDLMESKMANVKKQAKNAKNTTKPDLHQEISKFEKEWYARSYADRIRKPAKISCYIFVAHHYFWPIF